MKTKGNERQRWKRWKRWKRTDSPTVTRVLEFLRVALWDFMLRHASEGGPRAADGCLLSGDGVCGLRERPACRAIHRGAAGVEERVAVAGPRAELVVRRVKVLVAVGGLFLVAGSPGVRSLPVKPTRGVYYFNICMFRAASISPPMRAWPQPGGEAAACIPPAIKPAHGHVERTNERAGERTTRQSKSRVY